MYQTYFGLVETPFSIAPDPHYLYMSQRHQEALATLLFGVKGDGGFVLLTGEVGAGKTTICRYLLEQIPETCEIAYIFNPKLTVVELLSTICDEFGITYLHGNTSIKLFVDSINTYLLDAHAAGRRAVLIIDEAQNLSAEVLEQMRLLTNLETHQRKLLQIILLGQPELLVMLERSELRQLAQRIVARYHLGPLNKKEVAAYVKHRLEVSGAQRQLFPDTLMNKLYSLSGGVPRVINVLCDRALLGTFVQGKAHVDRSTLTQAAREVFNQQPKLEKFKRQALLGGLIVLMGSALAVALYHMNQVAPKGVIVQKAIVKHDKPLLPINSVALSQPSTKLVEVKSGEVLPVKLVFPADMPRSRSRAMAYAALFQAWNMNYLEASDPCLLAKTHDLHCRTTRGGLDELRRLNLPAVLYLLDDQGQEFYATLNKLEGESATFTTGTEVSKVNVSALASQWSGNYTVLLHLPQVTQDSILVGSHGLAVQWLRKKLEQLRGGAEEATYSSIYDDELKGQVKQFQLSQGLIPDGAVGPQTLARLSAMTDKSAPRLFQRQKGE